MLDDKKYTTVCQLHRLANGVVNEDTNIPRGTRNKVMICGDCNASLCLKCWETFYSKKGSTEDDFCTILSNDK